MATQAERITLLAQAIGADIKALNTNQGSLSSLSTTAAENIVAAINEINQISSENKTKIGDTGSLTQFDSSPDLITALVYLKSEIEKVQSSSSSIIDDSSDTSTDKTWSASKIYTSINSAISSIIDSSPAALDTLNELATALGNDPNFATTLATQMGYRVRVDEAQTFTAEEQAQACENLGIGDPTTDFLDAYNTAKL
jgi:hypothetical protein